MGLTGLLVGVFLIPPQGFRFSTCTMYNSTGFPCPGCGLTRSVASVYAGEFLAAWQYNPFGFVFALLFALLAPLVIVPASWLDALRRRLRSRGGALAIAGILFAGLLLAHGILRTALIWWGHPDYLWWSEQPSVPPAFRHLVEK